MITKDEDRKYLLLNVQCFSKGGPREEVINKLVALMSCSVTTSSMTITPTSVGVKEVTTVASKPAAAPLAIPKLVSCAQTALLSNDSIGLKGTEED